MPTRKWFWALVSLLLAAAPLMGGGPALAVGPAQTVNLLLNGGFEDATTAATATYWSAWWQETPRPSDGSLNYAFKPSWNVEKKTAGAAPELILAGNNAQRVINSWDPWWAGVKQVVSASAGARVRLTVSARLWAANSNWPTPSDTAVAARVQVGLEPNGSDNQFATTVVWSPAITPHTGWQTVTVETTVGAAGRVGVFLSADYRGYSRQFLSVFFDEASLVVVSSGTAVPGATNTLVPTATSTLPPNVTATPTAAPAPTGLPASYVVKAGDTLGAIAKRFNLTVATLMAANNLKNADRIYIGQVLVIRGGAGQSAAGVIIHVVQRGDTLNRLARRYNLSVAQIKAWNSLKTDVIYVGQRLIVGP